jgi:hypothetical protein
MGPPKKIIISRDETPYAPIISGGYVPKVIASFINGIKI